MSEKKATQKRKKVKSKAPAAPEVIHPEAAGIDIGATEIYVAVRADRDAKPVRRFESFTDDLHRIGDWLISCGVKTVAMESTGVYWIGLYQVLESKGLEVCLVNAQQAKHVPGRKTDVMDCQWLQTLHTFGLLRGSFRPSEEICAVRAIYRHRSQLVETSSCYVQHMQKALTQMSLQIQNVLSDLTGVSGLAIVDAIISGERDPVVLARLRDPRVKTDLRTIERSLIGNWKEEHLFALNQALEMYRHCQSKIEACDGKIHQMMAKMEAKSTEALSADLATGKKKKKKALSLRVKGINWEDELYRIYGVNLLQIPGISVATGLCLLSEVGVDLSRFKSVHHFSSWLRLSPSNKISGGQILSSRTPKHKPRLAIALRIAVQTLYRSQSALGDQFRRLKARLGAPKAITAMAHRLARIIYVMITKRVPYNETVQAQNEGKRLLQKENWLRKQAAALGLSLVPNQQVMNQVI